MTAQHNKMRRPDLDVPLTYGDGYCVEEKPYDAHLKATPEVKRVFSHQF